MGEEKTGQESSYLNSVAVKQYLLSGTTRCLNLALLFIVGALETLLPSLRVPHLQLTCQE